MYWTNIHNKATILVIELILTPFSPYRILKTYFMQKISGNIFLGHLGACFRVWFNGLWFLFHDSSQSFHKPYFSRKYIFYESQMVNKHKIMVLKLAKKSHIILHS